MPTAFVADPSGPIQLTETIERSISTANAANPSQSFHGWPENDIAGRPLTGPILSGIDQASFVVADVTYLNFNVTYEIGFAIGSRKRVYPIRNCTFDADSAILSKIGIFDTLGYIEYSDCESLSELLLSEIDATPLETTYPLEGEAPVYLLETPHRGDAVGHIISKIKKARLQYRSFIPSEDIRMAASDAIKHVACSHGVVIPLLSPAMRDALIHNIRAAFVASLAHGLEKPKLLLQDESAAAPLDVRDFSKPYRHLADMDEHIHDFALDVIQSMQESEPIDTTLTSTLATITIGDPMAENEFQTLERYYLRRDEFGRTLRSEVNLVVGRKGAGKTALFSQVRNDLRKDRAMIVVDLKPEGYQLVKLKEEVLGYLAQGAKAHLITAFWEYLLLLEVAYKLLEKDRGRQLRDHTIQPHYTKLQESYLSSPNAILGDFSERLVELSTFVSHEYAKRFGAAAGQKLTSDQVTEILHTQHIRELQNDISSYLNHKKGVWILFDNLDKGWTVPGPSPDDILILRCLIDAGRKIQREMQRKLHDFHCIVFIRNDVYELLMRESADFGKEMRVALDWNDAELLREMLRLRLVQNGYNIYTRFERIWTELCVSHYKTEETSQYMVDRCLMRPRNLLKIFNHCKGFAVNFGRKKIGAEDIEKGLRSYSNDLLIEADQELANIEPQSEGILYHFVGEGWKFTREELGILFEEHGLPQNKQDDVIGFLLYFGFLGVVLSGKEPMYIFDVGYDMKRLTVPMDKQGNNLEFSLNAAFWPALGVEP
ncbi:MAG: hypothetical protein OXF79_22660 [Chloroflexi bacterium]|nr:hypothetical protein [Chloroflexota bacterium]